MDSHQKFLGERGLRSQTFRAKYEAKLEFPGGRGVQKNLAWGLSIRMFSGTAQSEFRRELNLSTSAHWSEAGFERGC